MTEIEALRRACREALRLMVAEKANAELGSYGLEGVPGLSVEGARGAVERLLKAALSAPRTAEETSPEGAAPEEGDRSGRPQKIASPEGERVCEACGEEKPLEGFSKNRWGHTRTCKPCAAEKMAAGRRRRAAERAAEKEAKRESAPEPEALPEPSEPKPKPEPEAAPTPEVSEAEARPQPESEPQTNGLSRYCENGEECVQFPQLGVPAKLARGNVERECFACLEANHRGRKPRIPIVRKSGVR